LLFFAGRLRPRWAFSQTCSPSAGLTDKLEDHPSFLGVVSSSSSSSANNALIPSLDQQRRGLRERFVLALDLSHEAPNLALIGTTLALRRGTAQRSDGGLVCLGTPCVELGGVQAVTSQVRPELGLAQLTGLHHRLEPFLRRPVLNTLARLFGWGGFVVNNHVKHATRLSLPPRQRRLANPQFHPPTLSQ